MSAQPHCPHCCSTGSDLRRPSLPSLTAAPVQLELPSHLLRPRVNVTDRSLRRTGPRPTLPAARHGVRPSASYADPRAARPTHRGSLATSAAAVHRLPPTAPDTGPFRRCVRPSAAAVHRLPPTAPDTGPFRRCVRPSAAAVHRLPPTAPDTGPFRRCVRPSATPPPGTASAPRPSRTPRHLLQPHHPTLPTAHYGVRPPGQPWLPPLFGHGQRLLTPPCFLMCFRPSALPT